MNKKLGRGLGIGVVVIVLILIILSAGETKEEKEVIKNETGASQTEKNISLEKWPKEVPIFEGAKVKSFNESENDEKYFWSASLTVKEDKDSIYTWYNQALKDAGWTVSSDVVGGYKIVKARKGDLYTTYQIHFDDEKEESSISQQANLKKK